MTMLQIHADAVERVGTSYHEFLLHYKANARVVYGHVEGKDDPMFYRGFIEHCLPDGWEIDLLRAGNKASILKAYQLFDWSRFSPKRVCFFVDRDLSEFLHDQRIEAENLYITDNYSIENEAARIGTLQRILQEVLNINDLAVEETERLQSLFDSASSVFRSAMLPIMAQIILWRREGIRICLNNIEPKDFFTYTNGTLQLKPEFVSENSRIQHAAILVKATPSSTADLAAVKQEFINSSGLERFIRGKYVLWFIVEFALEIHRSICSLFPRFKVSPKLKLPFGPKNAMIVVAPRVRCPASLQSFLNRTYCQFIEETALLSRITV